MTPNNRQPPREHARATAIAEQFCDAIEASSPAFSASLHAEVMRGIRTEHGRNSSAHPVRLHSWHIAALGVAAAIVVLAVAIALLLASRSHEQPFVQHPQPTPAPRSPLIVPTLPHVAAIVEPVKNRVDRVPRELLNRSADRLHRYYTAQLRIFPTRLSRDAEDERTDVPPTPS